MTARSNAWVCGSSIAVIEGGSNPAEGMDFSRLCFFLCYVGSGLCDGLIICTEESYRVCVCVKLRVI